MERDTRQSRSQTRHSSTAHGGRLVKKPKVEKSLKQNGQVAERKQKPSKTAGGRPSSSPSVKKEPTTPVKRKPVISESDSDEDGPLAICPPQKFSVKHEVKQEIKQEVKLEPELEEEEQDGEIDVVMATTPVDQKVKAAKSDSRSKPRSAGPKTAGTKRKNTSDDDDEFKPSSAKKLASSAKKKSTGGSRDKKPRMTKPTPASPIKKGAAKTGSGSQRKGQKKEPEKEVRKWWEDEPLPAGVKWLTLLHKGPYFPPDYERLPPGVRFYYNGKAMELSDKAEEAATFFAKMLDHDYTKKDIFCSNFFADWRKEMTKEEAAIVKDLSKCDFLEMHRHFVVQSETKKAMSKEEKKTIKEANEKLVEEYGWCTIDGYEEKIGNFKIEPPGLFRGRGDHPKQGKIKRRVQPEDVIINIGKAADAPEPPEGHKWKSVQSDNKVTWLASWTENIQGAIKYIMLNPTSKLKAQNDLAKYETARRLKGHVDKIRSNYEEDWKAKEMRVRQRAVAVYFIDRLALRAGNEKDADESADTVGCCSLRVEHIKLHEELDGKENMVEFDFLGKDSIRYYNKVSVEKQVMKNLHLFIRGKEPGDDLFDRLTTTDLNRHLSELMPGLTAKVFRTYNASMTLQEQLDELTRDKDAVPSKLLSYNRANRTVAILCNHQRAPPKTFDQQMSNLQGKIQAKEELIVDTKKEIKSLRKEAKASKDSKVVKKLESKQKRLSQLNEQLEKLEVQATDKQENKEIALGTSKLNYLDPRITVSWCKKWQVPVEKVYNKSQRDKFAWAIDMADETFSF